MSSERKVIAERFMRGVYGGDPSVVDELAAADIVISYPIFQKIYDAPSIRGHEAVRNFVAHFASQWADCRLTIDEAVAEENSVVLVWSFSARNVGALDVDTPATQREHSWGGITLYRFNDEGKVAAEIGEESGPGPMARLQDHRLTP